jgi:cytosine/adenosine deaminase-related metal-dependent hydrolase
MDSNCPSHYIEESPASSVADTASLILHIRSLHDPSSPLEPLVQPIVTPRFAISCSAPLLQGLGDLVRKEKEAGTPVAVQTHLGESESAPIASSPPAKTDAVAPVSSSNQTMARLRSPKTSLVPRE